MTYGVKLSATARREAEEYHAFILQQSNDALPAANWWNGLLDTLDTLRTLPARCPHVPEQEKFDFPLHQLLYQSHRIIFRIDPTIVRVLRVYHSAGRPLTSLRQRARHGKRT